MPRLEWGPGNSIACAGGAGHAHAWTAHMPSTPVAVHDGRTGRAIKGGSPGVGGGGDGGAGGGDILVGAHGGGLFALPSTDGGKTRGLSLGVPGDSLGTVGALVPVAVSPTVRPDDDWACIPEKLWDDALTPGGLDSFLALHGVSGIGLSTDGGLALLTPLQRAVGSPVGAAVVVTVAVGFGTLVSYAALIARSRLNGLNGGSNSGSNGSKRGSRGRTEEEEQGQGRSGRSGRGGNGRGRRGRRRGSRAADAATLGGAPERLGSRRPSQRRPGDPRLRFVRDDSVRGRAGRPARRRQAAPRAIPRARARAGDADFVG